VFAFEEAIGYAFGTFVRDRMPLPLADARKWPLVFAEGRPFLTGWKSCTGIRLLCRKNSKPRHARIDGMEKMKRLMSDLRLNPR
jgi:hypothetical protein